MLKVNLYASSVNVLFFKFVSLITVLKKKQRMEYSNVYLNDLLVQ